MPKFQVKAPDGQLFEFYGPDGATQQQAEEYFRQNYKPSSPISQPESQPAIGGLADNVAKNVGLMKEPKYPAVVRAAQRTYEDIGQGLSDIGTGGLDFLYSGGQAVANIAGNDVLRGTQSILGLPQTEKPVEDINQYLRQREQGIQAEEAQRPQTGLINVNVPRMVGQIAPQIPFMPLKAVGLARGALQGGVQSAAFTPATGEGDYWTQKATQFGLGGLFSGVGDVALTGGRAILGTAKGPLTEAEKVIQAGKQANIPVRTTDVYRPQSWAGKKLQQVTDRIPIAGTGGNLVKTQAARQKSAEDFVKQYVPEAQSDPVWLKEINEEVKSKSQAKLERFKQLKASVLEKPEYNTSVDLFDAQTGLSKKARDYQKDISRLEDELSGGQNRGYADLLKEEMDPTYQAMRQGIDVKNWDEFSALLDGATQKMPRTAQPTTLLQRIRQLGGIKKGDYNIGDIKAMDINVRGKTKRQITSEGNLSVTNKPKSLDYMRESLVEEGWLNPNDDINSLLDLMQKDEMARNTGIGHIYKPADISKGLEYENSFQYDTQTSSARDYLYFNYGVDNPEVVKKEIYKNIDKAKKEFLKYEAKQGVSRSFSSEEINRLNNDLLQKKSQLNNLSRSIDKFASQKTSIPVPSVTAKIDSLKSEWERLAAGDDEEAARLVEILNKEKEIFNKNDGLGYLESKRELLSDKYANDPSAKDIANKIYAPLNEDIGNFLKAKSPSDYKKWKSGNQGLKILGDETKRTALSRVINKGAVVPEAAKSMILSQKPSEVANIGRYLNEKGKNNAKKVIVEDLFARSRIDGGDTIDPDKFLKIASQRNNQFKTFFSKQEQDAFDGLKTALMATKDAERFSKSTPWLQTVAISGVPLLGVFVGTGSAKAAAGVAAGVGLAGRAYQSKAMRDTLVALGRVKKNSTAEQRLIDKFISLQSGQMMAREQTK
jgi:hypothetical protein